MVGYTLRSGEEGIATAAFIEQMIDLKSLQSSPAFPKSPLQSAALSSSLRLLVLAELQTWLGCD